MHYFIGQEERVIIHIPKGFGKMRSEELNYLCTLIDSRQVGDTVWYLGKKYRITAIHCTYFFLQQLDVFGEPYHSYYSSNPAQYTISVPKASVIPTSEK